MTTKTFGKLRSFFWPIHSFELKKLLPMFCLFFLFSFNYSLLKDTKEPLLITAPGSGAEVIPFLKVWILLPLAILFMLLFAKLSRHVRKQTLFYGTVSVFIAFFALFIFVLYPLKEVIHPTELADRIQSYLPQGFSGLVAIFRHWSFALFYAFAELWGSMGISLLFWGFANDITHVGESKRFYSLLGLGTSIAMLIAGPTIIFFTNIRNKLPAGADAWGISLRHILLIIIGCGLLIMGIYWWINRYVLSDPRFFKKEESERIKKERPTLTLKEAFLYLIKSKHIRYIALLVIGYTTTISVMEIIWKSQLKLAFPHPNDYSTFRGYFTTITSLISLIMMFFVGSNMIRRLGWKAGALFTPILMIITGTGFFTCIIFRESLAHLMQGLGLTPVIIAVALGAIQLSLSKASKVALYEPTKEMAYIPLDVESRVKGKAAIDVIMHKISKGGAGLVQQGLILIFGSVIASTPLISLFIFVLLIGWTYGANALGNQFKKQVETPV